MAINIIPIVYTQSTVTVEFPSAIVDKNLLNNPIEYTQRSNFTIEEEVRPATGDVHITRIQEQGDGGTIEVLPDIGFFPTGFNA